MRRVLSLLVLLAGCAETAPQPPASAAVWQLASLDGAPFTARATLSFPEPGRFGGKAPCNSYFGDRTGTPPAFGAQRIAATMMACEALPDEVRYLAALGEMTRIEQAPDRLRLSNAAGREMIFVPAQP